MDLNAFHGIFLVISAVVLSMSTDLVHDYKVRKAIRQSQKASKDLQDTMGRLKAALKSYQEEL